MNTPSQFCDIKTLNRGILDIGLTEVLHWRETPPPLGTEEQLETEVVDVVMWSHVQNLQQTVRKVMAPVENWGLRPVSASFGLPCRCKVSSDITEFS